MVDFCDWWSFKECNSRLPNGIGDVMAGIFGELINNRVEFFSELKRAQDLCDRVLGAASNDQTIQMVKKQLEFIRQATIGGREPTHEERWSVDIALRLHREYEVIKDWDDLYDLKAAVTSLENYFNFWPSDELAANEDNDDLVDEEED